MPNERMSRAGRALHRDGVGGIDFQVEERVWAKVLLGKGTTAYRQMAPPTQGSDTTSHQSSLGTLDISTLGGHLSPRLTCCSFASCHPGPGPSHPRELYFPHLALWAPARVPLQPSSLLIIASPLPQPPPAEGRCTHP